MKRGTISRKASFAVNQLGKSFRSLYTKSDFKYQIKKLWDARNNSSRPAVLGELFYMFDQYGITYLQGMNNEYYAKIVKTEQFLSFEEIRERVISELFQMYTSYLSPPEYMYRLVDRFSFAEDEWEQDTVRVRILKQFIKYGNYLADAGYGGKTVIQEYVGKKLWKRPTEEDVLSCTDDALFRVLETASRPQKKPGGKFGLLKLADDLAAGRVKSGTAKKGLYLFAMVFGMNYGMAERYMWNAEDKKDPYGRDIEKNIFSYHGFINQVGINYQNFAEMIYLYCLNTDNFPAEKIRRASEMIMQLKTEEKGKGHPKREWFYSEDILSLPEQEFMETIRENYCCDTFKPREQEEYGYYTGEMQIGEDKRAADEQYRKIQEMLWETEKKSDCRYGLCFFAKGDDENGRFDHICSGMAEDKQKKFREFMKQLKKINTFLVNWQRKKVSRASLIAAFYYYYNAKYGEGTKKGKSFEMVFNHFCREANVWLDRAGYPRINGRYVFDVLLIFSVFEYLYNGPCDW